MIIITSLDRDFFPSSWSNFIATFWDNLRCTERSDCLSPVYAFRAVLSNDFHVGGARTAAVFQAGRRNRDVSDEEVAEIEVYGVAAEFDDPTAFVEAKKVAREAGYRK